ncbi:hypothetical protein [Azospirillum picis]|uniref:Uncharacterized protein n=1 Tax=Azospirillum picis TaxID=488438 RepID=A0ABU0MQ93_9PROT|nr:hypothetical protein [Azospirillum picis]MBP2302059.1 hypothetical protein [Azospirillum picis]MDQ0535650.1 hypothetical protein [Azospirillum picis]
MSTKRQIDRDHCADVLAEARRIVAAGDESALSPTASLNDLHAILADNFDETYTAERIIGLLATDNWKAGGADIRLPADVLERLREIADEPVEAIRMLLASGAGRPEPGSEEYCRVRHCDAHALLSDPGAWVCGTCGLGGRVDQTFNQVIRERLSAQTGHIADLHTLAADIHEMWGGGARFTVADGVARQLLGGRIDRERLKHLLADLVEAGLIEEAPGPRGGAGYRTLEEPPDWIAGVMAERRERQEAEARIRGERAAALKRVLEEGMTYTTSGGDVVEINQSERGMELSFPSIPSWDLRDDMKRQGRCRWDGRRRRWCRTSPVTSVEPWLAAALDAGATVAPLGTADPDAEDWEYGDWQD